MRQTVILSPHVDLHTGAHGSLLESGPDEVSLHLRGARHHFLFPETAETWSHQAPFERPHLAELIELGPGPQVVHSIRWPVVNRRSWVVDLDDLGFPMLLGRHFLHPEVSDSEDAAWDGERVRALHARARAMLTGYAHPSCRALLFWTKSALEDATEWFRLLDLEELGGAVLAKSRVIYPAQRPLLESSVREKWDRPTGLHVLFVGNDYWVKQGRLALRVFGRLARELPACRFTYVGRVPEEDHHLTEGLDYRGTVSRREILALFRQSHVLFHPARAESFGMVFAEATANALATIAARGPEMRHMEEIFPRDEALLLDRDTVDPEEEESHFERLLRSLLGDPERARQLAMESYRNAVEGPLSIELRNAALRTVYASAAADPADTILDPRSLSVHGPSSILTLRSDEVKAAESAFRESRHLRGLNFYLGLPGLVNALTAESAALDVQ